MMMPTVGMGRPADDGGSGQRRQLPRAAWLALGPLAGLASELIVAHFDPPIEMITTICGVGVPTAFAVVLFLIALFGSDSQQERAYRLLRWLKDKPEPTKPPESLPQPPRSSKVATRSRRSRGRRQRRKL
jgi:hypothetical protein